MRGPKEEALAREAGDAAIRRPILGPDQLDDLARTVLALAREVWVLRDRQRITELVLAERGIAIAEAIDAYRPDAETQRMLDAERAAFVQGLLENLAPKRD